MLRARSRRKRSSTAYRVGGLRSIHPEALWIRSWRSPKSISAMRSVSLKSSWRIAQRAKAPFDRLRRHYLTIQTSFESSLSLASLARASVSDENFTRTLNVIPFSLVERST